MACCQCRKTSDCELQEQADSVELSFDWHVTETEKQTEQRIGIIGAVLRAQPRMVPFVERLLLISEKMGS